MFITVGSKRTRTLIDGEWNALNDLRNKTTIIVTKPEQGNGVLAISLIECIPKMNNFLYIYLLVKQNFDHELKSKHKTELQKLFEKLESKKHRYH